MKTQQLLRIIVHHHGYLHATFVMQPFIHRLGQ